MSERLADMQRAINDSRRRLEALAQRAAALRERVARPDERPDAAEPESGRGPRQAQDQADEDPFLYEDNGPAPGVMNDLDLNFEALDVEGSDREET
jgi:hypothetical protein